MAWEMTGIGRPMFGQSAHVKTKFAREVCNFRGGRNRIDRTHWTASLGY